MKIYIKQIYDENGKKIPITIPKKASEVAAGYDIVATSDPKIVGIKLDENGWDSIDYIEYETNLYIAPEAVSFHTLIHPRSSVSKYNLVLANSVGLVDNDYRGMVICRFKYVWQPNDFRMNTNNLFNGIVNMNKIYKKGDTIAQLVFEPTVMVDFELVDDLTKTKRGAGGFGSTDLNELTSKPLSYIYDESGGSLGTIQ